MYWNLVNLSLRQDARLKKLDALRHEAEALHESLEAQMDEPSEEQLDRLAALYDKICKLQTDYQEELF